jgi:CRISPR-associated protein Csx10
VRYLNAYPAIPDRTLPASRAWATKKDKGDMVYDRTDADQKAEVEVDLPKPFGKPFISQDSKSCPAVDYEVAIHTARNREYGRALENDTQSALFRYQALARDQEFKGVILFDEADAAHVDTVYALLKEQEPLFLGGSHRAGYGLSLLTDATKLADWHEAPSTGIKSGDTSFRLYLTSDAILTDPSTGGPATSIEPFLPSELGEIVVSESFVTKSWVGGFNAHWGLPLSQQWAFRMGSTWVVTPKSGLSQAGVDALKAIEHRGIGQRSAEGFGRFLIAPDWPAKAFEPTKRSLLSMPPGNNEKPEGSDGLLQQMNKRLVRSELDRLLAAKINELAQKSNVRGRLSNSQLARIQLRIRREGTSKHLGSFVDYLTGTKERKSADEQFRKYRMVGLGNLRDYLLKLAENPKTIWNQFVPESWQPSQIGQQPYDYRADGDLAHEYTIKFISGLCRQLAKLKEER